MEEDEFDEKLVFSHEAAFRTSGKVSKQNVRIWELENLHESLEHVRDSPKVNFFLQFSRKMFMAPTFLMRM